MTFNEFITHAGLIFSFVQLLTRTSNDTDWPDGAVHFQVCVTRDTRHYAVEYSAGPGCVEHWAREQKGVRPWSRDLRAPRKSVAYAEGLAKASKAYKPDPADVLQSLQVDCSVSYHDTFEDWASEFGYDLDSRKAERTYDACRKTAKAMRDVLGAELFETFMQLEE